MIIKNEKNRKKLKNSKREITIILVIMMVLILFFSGYSIGKGIAKINIEGEAKIAEPILIVENGSIIDITSAKNTGCYNFKVKNYNEEGKITQVDLIYNIEILSKTDESIIYKLYKNDEEVKLIKNKTQDFLLTNEKKQEESYKLEVVYDKNKSISVEDIVEQVQIKVHSEQKRDA